LVAGIIALLISSTVFLRRGIEERLATTYDVSIDPIEIPTDQASIERGRHLVSTIYFCQECHGENLGGELYFDDPLSGQVSAPNLTAGAGGIGREFGDSDWVRAIRHGLNRDGLPLIVMPSNSYYYIGDRDMGAIIAYLKDLPSIDSQLLERDLGLLSYLTLQSDSSLIPAETIDHDGPRPPVPEPGVTIEYGKYLAAACTICHGPELSGGPTAGAGLDLTGSGNLAKWSEAEFVNTLRTGRTPRGEELDPRLMPWKRVGDLTDDELKAIWLYLQTLQ
jgi:mono/diheme cytochrome c family protein